MSQNRATLPWRIILISLVFILILISLAGLALCIGPSRWDLNALVQVFFGQATADPTLATIVWDIRLPRAALAALSGGTLALGGLVFQAMLRNPLADPYILGVSGGSAVGAIVAVILGLPRYPGMSILAFLGSLTTVLAVLFLTSGRKNPGKETLLLSGVMVNALCSAVILFLLAMVPNQNLAGAVFWLMGDLSAAEGYHVFVLTVLTLPCAAMIFLLSNSMNLMVLGQESAQSLGVNVAATRNSLLVITSLMVSAAVCQTGPLGFVGLVIPHILRRMLGGDHRILVPASFLGGGCFMILCDMLARILSPQGEMPVGVITALVGAPLFILLLKRESA